MHNKGGGWVFTSKSPEGPWEKHKGGCYYDMGLLIDDDDTMYVASGNNTISVAQLSADGFSQVKSQTVFQTPGDLSGPLEGSRFIKKDGVYYIFTTQYANGEYVLRSTKGPFGPYEMRPFAVRVPYAGAPGSGGSPHQGGIVQTQNGDWYYLGFNDSYPAGRIPVMAPMTWNDGWPSLTLVDGKWGGTYPFPDLPCGSNRVKPPVTKDTFAEATLRPEWEWNHNPDSTKWSSGAGLTLLDGDGDRRSVRRSKHVDAPCRRTRLDRDDQARLQQDAERRRRRPCRPARRIGVDRGQEGQRGSARRDDQRRQHEHLLGHDGQGHRGGWR